MCHPSDNIVLYTIPCQCGSDDCEINISFFNNKENNSVKIDFYKTLYFQNLPHFENSYFKRILYRWKVAMKIIFQGWFSLSSNMTLGGEEHLDRFIEILKQGKNHCEKLKKENLMLKNAYPDCGISLINSSHN